VPGVVAASQTQIGVDAGAGSGDGTARPAASGGAPVHPGCFDYIFLHELIESQRRPCIGIRISVSCRVSCNPKQQPLPAGRRARSLLESVRSELHNRRKGDAVRLEIASDAAPEIVEQLRANFDLDDIQIFYTDGPVNLSRLMTACQNKQARAEISFVCSARAKAASRIGEPVRRDPAPRPAAASPIRLLHAVVEFIRAAAEDPAVLSIKQTLYRTSANSQFSRRCEKPPRQGSDRCCGTDGPLRRSLHIRWAHDLEDAGVQVFYGTVGLKTHCKLALLVRRDPEDGVVRQYAHLGTVITTWKRRLSIRT